MLNKLLEYIQQQPRATREMYALSGTVAITLLIALLWVGQLATTANPYTQTANVPHRLTEVGDIQGNAPPFSGLWRQFKEIIAQPDMEVDNNPPVLNEEKEIQVKYVDEDLLQTDADSSSTASSSRAIQIVPAQ